MIDFFVAGEPATQSGTRAVPVGGGGRFRHISTGSRGLAAWRQRVAYAAQREATPIADGPAVLLVHFILPRPKSRPLRHQWPDRRPDLSKVLRAVEDACTGVLLADDARICVEQAIKTYAAPGQHPGVRSLLRALGPDEAEDPYAVLLTLADHARQASQTLCGDAGPEV